MRLIISTAPAEAAPELARTLVEQKLAACVNIVPQVQSIYVWENQLQDDRESMMWIKTTAAAAKPLVEELRKLHPYDVPEIICVEIDQDSSSQPYLQWIGQSVRSV